MVGIYLSSMVPDPLQTAILKGLQQGLNLKGQNPDLKGQNLDLKGQNLDLKGLKNILLKYIWLVAKNREFIEAPLL